MNAIPAAEPSLADVLRDIWNAKVCLLCGALFGLAAGFAFFALAVPQYRATMLVAPRPAAQTATDFNAADPSAFARFQTVIVEKTVAAVLLQDARVRDGLAQAGRFRFRQEPVPATAEELALWLADGVRVEPVGETVLRRVVVLHPDPEFAAYLLNRLYGVTDGLIRGAAETDVAQRLAWLKSELARTDNPDHRRALADLLMEQERLRMMLSANEPYAAALAEPPAAGPKPYWPRRLMSLAAFIFAGAFLGYAVHGLRR